MRRQGFSNITKEQVLFQGKNGIIENLKAIWDEHSEDDWGKFEKEEVCRYICGKIALGEASFLTTKTNDRVRGFYRLISERIRQYQNITSNERNPNK